MKGTAYCDGYEGEDSEGMLLSETVPWEHHIQREFREEFQVRNRQKSTETRLHPAVKGYWQQASH